MKAISSVLIVMFVLFSLCFPAAAEEVECYPFLGQIVNNVSEKIMEDDAYLTPLLGLDPAKILIYCTNQCVKASDDTQEECKDICGADLADRYNSFAAPTRAGAHTLLDGYMIPLAKFALDRGIEMPNFSNSWRKLVRIEKKKNKILKKMRDELWEVQMNCEAVAEPEIGSGIEPEIEFEGE